MRPASLCDTGAGARLRSEFSNSDSFICVWLDVFAQRFECVPITARDRIDGFLERLRDLREGQVSPDLQDDDFALWLRELRKRRLDGIRVFPIRNCGIE